MSLNPKELFGDRDASKIDEAIAKSVVSNYVGASNLRKLGGNYALGLPEEFEAWYQKWGKSDEDVDEVPGFVNRDDKAKPIKLRLPGKYKTPATFEAAIHETIHLNAAFDDKQGRGKFQIVFGRNYNEGVTEYFTEKVLDAGMNGGAAYRDQLALANGLIKSVGESDVADAYFKDQARNLHLRIQKAFVSANLSNSLPEWLQKRESKNAQDMQKADKLLQAALANPVSSGSGAANSSGSGSASAGSGSRP
jgi:hypothetical protein